MKQYRTFYLFVVIFILLGNFTFSQKDSISLAVCLSKANENFPLIKQRGLLSESSSLKIKNIAADNFPNLSLNGQATYQSDVTNVSLVMPEIPGIGQIPSPDMPVPSKDQYKISLDVSQPIWDGGISKSRKNIENASLEADLQNVEVDIYKLWPQINNLYFSILVYEKNIETINLLSSELKDKLLVAQSALRNGVADSSSIEIINAELINIERQIIELEEGKRASVEMLKTIILFEIDDNTFFSIPNPGDFIIEGNRPELKLFELNRQKIEVSEKLISGKSSPKIYGFGQLGYGRPGLNMLSDDFDSFWIVGAKVSWNITDLKKNSREKQILEISKDMINVQEDVFKNSVDVQREKIEAEITKYNSLAEKSKELYEIRKSIAEKSSSKFKNGVISSNDLISDLNAKTRALLNLEFYKLQLIKAEVDLLTTNGNLKIYANENK
ncbi:MAG: TolC family protein [Bacteroidales bacterium]|nr:TolC family protein [Bacteroidales bacterium]